jgi:carbonic anhydrase/acetyltransferase-like protein (isoleucine patch superfamily)
MPLYRLGDRVPSIAPTAFVFDNATLIGSVTLEAGVSVWPYVTIRGDNEPIVVRAGSNLQENCVLHTDPGCPLVVERNVTVGHQAMLHGCTIGEGSLIGIQAVILNRAVIGRNCLIGAGALVTEGKVIPDGSLVVGSPAKVLREMKPEEIERMHANTAHYVQRGVDYSMQLVRIG